MVATELRLEDDPQVKDGQVMAELLMRDKLIGADLRSQLCVLTVKDSDTLTYGDIETLDAAITAAADRGLKDSSVRGVWLAARPPAVV